MKTNLDKWKEEDESLAKNVLVGAVMIVAVPTAIAYYFGKSVVDTAKETFK